MCFIINGTWAAHVASCSYLLAAHPGGRCPKSGGTWWCWQPASQRRWGGKAPTPACPDPDAESAPDCWTAAALDHTNATASPEHTWRNIKIVGGRITCTLPHLKSSRNVRILLSSHFESSNRSEFLLFWRCSSEMVIAVCIIRGLGADEINLYNNNNNNKFIFKNTLPFHSHLLAWHNPLGETTCPIG